MNRLKLPFVALLAVAALLPAIASGGPWPVALPKDKKKQLNELIKRIEKEPSQRLKYLRAAAELGSTDAMCLVGDAEKEPAAAATWYRRALTKDGKERGPTLLDDKLLMFFLDRDYGRAAFRLAEWLRTKKIQPLKHESVEFYLRIAADRGETKAVIPLAELLLRTQRPRKMDEAAGNLEKFIARHRDSKTSPAGGVRGAALLAMVYMNGTRSVQPKASRALEMFELGASWGDLQAAESAGMLLMGGRGDVPQDVKRGVAMLRRAAKGLPLREGRITAKKVLVGIHVSGQHVKPDPGLAAALLLQIAWLTADSAGTVGEAQQAVGALPGLTAHFKQVDLKFQSRMMKHCADSVALHAAAAAKARSGADLSDPKVRMRLLDALPKDNVPAQVRLAALVAETDPARAREMLTLACAADHPEASHLMMEWCYLGKYGPKDPKAAGRNALRAAKLYARMGLVGKASGLMPYVKKLSGEAGADEVRRLWKIADDRGIAHSYLG